MSSCEQRRAPATPSCWLRESVSLCWRPLRLLAELNPVAPSALLFRMLLQPVATQRHRGAPRGALARCRLFVRRLTRQRVLARTPLAKPPHPRRQSRRASRRRCGASGGGPARSCRPLSRRWGGKDIKSFQKENKHRKEIRVAYKRHCRAAFSSVSNYQCKLTPNRCCRP